MKAEARFFFLAISSAVPVGFQRSNFLRPVLPRKLSTYSRRVELGSAVGSSGVSAGMFCRVNQLSTDLRNSWKSSYCSVVFQSKDGVTSEIDGWFGSSFASAAVRAAIGLPDPVAAWLKVCQKSVLRPLKVTIPQRTVM